SSSSSSPSSSSLSSSSFSSSSSSTRDFLVSSDTSPLLSLSSAASLSTSSNLSPSFNLPAPLHSSPTLYSASDRQTTDISTSSAFANVGSATTRATPIAATPTTVSLASDGETHISELFLTSEPSIEPGHGEQKTTDSLQEPTTKWPQEGSPGIRVKGHSNKEVPNKQLHKTVICQPCSPMCQPGAAACTGPGDDQCLRGCRFARVRDSRKLAVLSRITR
ncbi:unnamed protein product, partial [Protopolystoma xenopodis]